MSDGYTLENISELRAMPLVSSPGWSITFTSDNTGYYHQLYVNGRLAQFSDTPNQRTFVTGDDATGARIAVIAVAEQYLATDLATVLPADHRQPGWVKSVDIIQDVNLPAATTVSLLTDNATGVIDTVPLASGRLWPELFSRWAWGEDTFGCGGFGYDGDLAPGAGQAAFGAGMFGFGADVITLSAPMLIEGTHQLTIRTAGADGNFTDQQLGEFIATPPPPPCGSIIVTAYDNQTNQLTFEIN